MSKFLTFAGFLLATLLAATMPARANILSIGFGTAVLGSHAGNLILNGGFETGASGNQGWTGNGPHTGAWPGGPGVAIPSWTGTYPTGAYGWWGPVPFIAVPCTEGTNCVYFGNWITSASITPTFLSNGEVTFAGPVSFANTVAANQGAVTLAQTVLLTPGDTYLLDFWTTGEGQALPSGVFGLSIGSQTVFLEAVTADRRYYVSFVATTASTTIAFSNWGHLNNFGFATELVLDDVILNRTAAAVPEPSSLVALGGALLALALGRANARRRA